MLSLLHCIDIYSEKENRVSVPCLVSALCCSTNGMNEHSCLVTQLKWYSNHTSISSRCLCVLCTESWKIERDTLGYCTVTI